MAEADRGWLADQAATARRAMLRTGLQGHDPYDALLSPLFRLPVLKSRWAPRFAAQQIVLRSPLDLRGLLRVPAQLNPVTVGLYLNGIADLTAAGEIELDRGRSEAERWIEVLETQVTPGYSGPCWGYPFPWEGRRHRMPSRTPTVVATSIVVDALYRSRQVFGEDVDNQMTVKSARFVLDDLPRSVERGDTICWAYSPLDDQQVLNATLKGSRLLVQAIDAGLEESVAGEARRVAEASARFVIREQCPDGGWPYAVGGDPRSWRDHHHTGYVLDCLDEVIRVGGMSEFEPALARGLEHYLESFFTATALPRYFDDRDGPVDATAAGQSLLTLSRFGQLELATDVARASTAALGHDDGTFAYREGRTSRTHFIRWSTAWMFAGFSRLLRARTDAR